MRLRKQGIGQHPTIPVMFVGIAVSLQDGMSSELTRGKLGISTLILVHEGHIVLFIQAKINLIELRQNLNR